MVTQFVLLLIQLSMDQQKLLLWHIPEWPGASSLHITSMNVGAPTSLARWYRTLVLFSSPAPLNTASSVLPSYTSCGRISAGYLTASPLPQQRGLTSSRLSITSGPPTTTLSTVLKPTKAFLLGS